MPSCLVAWRVRMLCLAQPSPLTACPTQCTSTEALLNRCASADALVDRLNCSICSTVPSDSLSTCCGGKDGRRWGGRIGPDGTRRCGASACATLSQRSHTVPIATRWFGHLQQSRAAGVAGHDCRSGQRCDTNGGQQQQAACRKATRHHWTVMRGGDCASEAL